jgi:hypothetical protein
MSGVIGLQTGGLIVISASSSSFSILSIPLFGVELGSFWSDFVTSAQFFIVPTVAVTFVTIWKAAV